MSFAVAISEEQEALARAIHTRSMVIDSLAVDLGPYTTTMVSELDAMIDHHVSHQVIYPRMKDLADEGIVDGTDRDYWQWWDESGVDVASITMGGFGNAPFSFATAVRDLGRWQRRFDACPQLLKVTNEDDLNNLDERHGVILNLQNSEHIEGDLEKLEVLRNLGIRVIQLTYNLRNDVGDGCAERNPTGLSRFGLRVVERMNQLGIVVDVSHCSEATTLDAIEVSQHPIAITHATCAALVPHDRAKSDEVIRRLGERNGYFGILLVPHFLNSARPATLDDFLDHLDHVVQLIGPANVGIGSDWGLENPPQLNQLLDRAFADLGFRPEHGTDFAARTAGFASWRNWPNLTRALVGRGYTDDEVTGFIGGNFCRLFTEVVS